MNKIVVITFQVIANRPAAMPFADGDNTVQDLAPTTPHHLSAMPFCQGNRMVVRFGFRPVAFETSVSSSNLESRFMIG
jgi:hypothetical protein